MRRVFLLLYILIVPFLAISQTDVLIDLAKDVNGTSGGYNFAITILVVFVSAQFAVIVYLYRGKEILHKETGEQAVKTLEVVLGLKNILANTSTANIETSKAVLSKLSEIEKDIAKNSCRAK